MPTLNDIAITQMRTLLSASSVKRLPDAGKMHTSLSKPAP